MVRRTIVRVGSDYALLDAQQPPTTAHHGFEKRCQIVAKALQDDSKLEEIFEKVIKITENDFVEFLKARGFQVHKSLHQRIGMSARRTLGLRDPFQDDTWFNRNGYAADMQIVAMKLEKETQNIANGIVGDDEDRTMITRIRSQLNSANKETARRATSCATR